MEIEGGDNCLKSTLKESTDYVYLILIIFQSITFMFEVIACPSTICESSDGFRYRHFCQWHLNMLFY